MAVKPVYLFPLLTGSITDETKMPIAQRSNAESPVDQIITPPKIKEYLESKGMIAIAVGGPYTDDDAAAAAGVALGEYYELTSPNNYSLPGGLVKARTV